MISRRQMPLIVLILFVGIAFIGYFLIRRFSGADLKERSQNITGLGYFEVVKKLGEPDVEFGLVDSLSYPIQHAHPIPTRPQGDRTVLYIQGVLYVYIFYDSNDRVLHVHYSRS